MTIRVSAGSGRLIVNTSYDPVLAYRIVKDAKRGDPAMLDSLRSNYERGTRPRGVEVRLALIHFGLSMYLTREMAAATAQRWPRLGNHLAEIDSSLRVALAGHTLASAGTSRSGDVRPSCSLA